METVASFALIRAHYYTRVDALQCVPLSRCPRPCAVESHARGYKNRTAAIMRCHGPCAVESHARGCKNRTAAIMRCHGLAPWSLTLDALVNGVGASAENVSLQGTRPCHPQSVLSYFVAASVRLHGARSWHLNPGFHAVFAVRGSEKLLTTNVPVRRLCNTLIIVG